ncbi:adenylosuccinate lyase family protein [Paenarthrobacter sp. NPDC089714]|uniref:class-II fumarase/aspartase family protein n=1 Tax=Paenarthrobacter sp. NPDC089714 TaxID=3364377 RepID=UPI003808C147
MIDGDFGLLSPVTASPAVTALTGDRAVIAAILDVESAWAAVLEDAGLAPEGSAAVVAEAADPRHYDLALIAERAQGGANPVIPLLGELRAKVRELDADGIGAASAVHTSLTSQDVLDSALMLLASRTVSALLAEVQGTTTALAASAEQHADTLCVGRSLTQHALPYSFGLRSAQWFQGVAAAASRLTSLELPVQFGGAGGTLASGTKLTGGSGSAAASGLAVSPGSGPASAVSPGSGPASAVSSGSTPFTLADSLASKLGLSPAVAPWHTHRLAVTGLGDALTALVDSFGKIAADLLFLSRPEVAELGEPMAAGRGVSSAMPQKQNPVLSVLVRSAALQAPGLASQLHLAAATFNDERPDGAWHTEWPALRRLLALTIGAAIQLRELTEGLRVFPEAMRRNLEISGPLLVSEGVSAAVAPRLGDDGKQKLQAVVDETLTAPASEQSDTYRKLLREAVPADKLPDDELDALLDPASYLGEATEISRRILAAYPDFTSSTKGAPRG